MEMPAMEFPIVVETAMLKYNFLMVISSKAKKKEKRKKGRTVCKGLFNNVIYMNKIEDRKTKTRLKIHV